MDMRELQTKANDLRIQIKPDLSVDEINKMQLEAIQFASSLTFPVYQARLEENKKSATARHEFTKAFQLSEGGSDRKKEADARSNEKVRGAEALHFAAECERKLLEDMKQDFRELHHSLRAILKDKTVERWSDN